MGSPVDERIDSSGCSPARVGLDPAFQVGELNGRIFGSFVEHMGRCVYTGVYEPDHPSADEHGFRGDVAELVTELGPTVLRYPGGNFVSNYHWEDGVGPRSERPTKLDFGWRTLETNQVGTDDFLSWCARLGIEPMMAVNLGTRGISEALELLQYTNGTEATTWPQQRVANGYPDPHGVRVWCLGNEMDGPWQMNHRTAHEYGRVANEVGRGMKTFDPSLELVACGSSHAQMPTYPDWEAEVLTECYDAVDYISLHTYWDNFDNDYLNFVAKSVPLERYIHTVGGIIDYVKAKKRSKHDVFISFDE
ncbi:MAG TPA: alpha-L-arabinofuranosidase, partial [Propionibacteriaceae bacterium]